MFYMSSRASERKRSLILRVLQFALTGLLSAFHAIEPPNGQLDLLKGTHVFFRRDRPIDDSDSASPSSSTSSLVQLDARQPVANQSVGQVDVKAFVMMLRDNATTDDMSVVCEALRSNGAMCTARGSPEAGGLPFVIASGTLFQIQATMSAGVPQQLTSSVEEDVPSSLEGAGPSAANDKGCDYAKVIQSLPWHLTRVRVRSRQEAQNKSLSLTKLLGMGHGAHVYVLSSGLNPEHADLQGRAVAEVDTTSGVLIECNLRKTCAGDENGQGTSLASLVGGYHFGVATGALLHSLKVLDKQGLGEVANVMLAFDWLLRNAQSPAVVVLGFMKRGESKALRAGVDRLYQSFVLVAEAGDGEGLDACVVSPGSYSNIITVGATRLDDEFADFSNKGGECVDLLAPGVVVAAGIVGNNYCRTFSSTAAAAALVAGMAAVIVADDPSRPPSYVISRLLQDSSRVRPAPNKLLYIHEYTEGSSLAREAGETDMEARGDDAAMDEENQMLKLYPYNDFAWAFAGYSDECALGGDQSPIDLPKCDAESPSGKRIDQDWDATKGRLVLRHNTIQMEMYSGPITKFNGEALTMRDCSFHIPSQHYIDGQQYSMEMECIHEGSGGGLGALSFLFANSGAEPDILNVIVDSLPDKDIAARNLVREFLFDRLALHMRGSSLFRYPGSLSIPPCTQNVTRIVVKNPLRVTPNQVSKFQAAMGVKENVRRLQPHKNRCVYACSDTCTRSHSSLGEDNPSGLLNGAITLSAVYDLPMTTDREPSWAGKFQSMARELIAAAAGIPPTSVVATAKRMEYNSRRIHLSTLVGLRSTEFSSVKEVTEAVRRVMQTEVADILSDDVKMVKFYFNKPTTSLRSGGLNKAFSSNSNATKSMEAWAQPTRTGPPLRFRTLMVPAHERDFGRPSCRCIGIAGLDGITEIVVGSHVGVNGLAKYPVEVGSSCHAWDDGFHPLSCTRRDQDPGKGNGWCKERWCFVDPCACDLAEPPSKSSYFPNVQVNGRPLYFSYATCADLQLQPKSLGCQGFLNMSDCEEQPNCGWSRLKHMCMTAELRNICSQSDAPYQVEGKSSCRCVGLRDVPGIVSAWLKNGEIVEYPATHGSSCAAWDDGNYLGNCTNTKGQTPGSGKGFCAQRWCYVDPCQCDLHEAAELAEHLPFASFQGRPLVQSYKTCSGADTPSVPGYNCGMHTQEARCENNGNGQCKWTSLGCVRKSLLKICHASLQLFGKSSLKVQLAKRGVSSCPCVGVEGIKGATQADFGGGKFVAYPREVGSYCKAWDDGRFPGLCQEGDTPGRGQGMCAQRWCFVDPCNCNLPNKPLKAVNFPGALYQGRPLYYSYATCQSNASFGEAVPELKDVGLAFPESVSKLDESAVDPFAVKPITGCGQSMSAESCNQLNGCIWKPTMTPDGRFVQEAGTCVDEAIAKSCEVDTDTQVWGQRECPCVGVKGLGGLIQVKFKEWSADVDYPADIGSYCRPWHMGYHPGCPQGTDSEACTVRWCFVDPCSCRNPSFWQHNVLLPKANVDGRVLYVSNVTCNLDRVLSRSEPEAKCDTKDTRLTCLLEPRCGWTGRSCVDREMQELCRIDNVLPTTTTTTLLDLLGHERCPCVGFAGLQGETRVDLIGNNKTIILDLTYGSRCDSWDDGVLGGFCKNEMQSPGLHRGWCALKWCFVDPCNCELNELPSPARTKPQMTFRGKPLYYSYETCADYSYWSKVQKNSRPVCREQPTAAHCSRYAECAWFDDDTGPARCMGREQAKMCKPKLDYFDFGRRDCQCIGIGGAEGRLTGILAGANVKYPADLGSRCHTWDLSDKINMSLCAGSAPPQYCKRWCFVDPCKCSLNVPPTQSNRLPGASWEGKPLFVSYETCGATSLKIPDKTEVCENKPHWKVCNAQIGCAWTGYSCVRAHLAGYCDGLDWPSLMATNVTRPGRSKQPLMNSDKTGKKIPEPITADSVHSGLKTGKPCLINPPKAGALEQARASVPPKMPPLPQRAKEGRPPRPQRRFGIPWRLGRQLADVRTHQAAAAAVASEGHAGSLEEASLARGRDHIGDSAAKPGARRASCGSMSCGTRWHRYVAKGDDFFMPFCRGPRCDDDGDIETCCTEQANCASHVCPVTMKRRRNAHARLCSGFVCDNEKDRETCCYARMGEDWGMRDVAVNNELPPIFVALGIFVALSPVVCLYHFCCRRASGTKTSD